MFKASRATVELTNRLLLGLRSVGISVDDPAEWAKPDTEFDLVCSANQLCVANCKLMVCVATDPSTGLGSEMAIRRSLGRSMVGVFFKGEPYAAWARFLAPAHVMIDRRKMSESLPELILHLKLLLRDQD
jgi:hypothetical protein